MGCTDFLCSGCLPLPLLPLSVCFRFFYFSEQCQGIAPGKNAVVKIAYKRQILRLTDPICVRIMGDPISDPTNMLQFLIIGIPRRNAILSSMSAALHLRNIFTDTVLSGIHIGAELVQAFVFFKKLVVGRLQCVHLPFLIS